jgi:hypothetical protein
MTVVARDITDTQSYSIVIRDSIFAALVTLPFFQGFKARRSKMLQVQPELIPYLGIYIVDEDMQPDGDANHGDIRFIHTLRLGFSVVIKNNDPVQAELVLDQAFWAIMNGIWCNDGITNLLLSGMPDNTRIEGVQRGQRKHVWGTPALNNEMAIGEMQYVASVRYRSAFAPTIPDDLLRIHVETVPLGTDGTIPPADEVQRIISEYEFTPAP